MLDSYRAAVRRGHNWLVLGQLLAILTITAALFTRSAPLAWLGVGIFAFGAIISFTMMILNVRQTGQLMQQLLRQNDGESTTERHRLHRLLTTHPVSAGLVAFGLAFGVMLIIVNWVQR